MYDSLLRRYEKEISQEEEAKAKRLSDHAAEKKAQMDFRNQQTQETQDTAKEILIAKLAYENEQIKKQLEELKNAQPKTDSVVQ